MNTNKLENLSLEELQTKREKTKSLRTAAWIIWIILIVAAMGYVMSKIRQGDGSNLIPLLPIYVVATMLLTLPIRNALKKIDKEIEKRG